MSFVVIEVALAAVLYVLFSVTLQRKLVDIKKMRETQRQMQSKMKELKEIMKTSKDDKAIAEKNKEIMELTSSTMSSQFKLLAVIFPIGLLVYYVVLPTAFAHQPFSLTLFSISLTYKTFFIVVTFVLGLISSVVISFYDKMLIKKAAQTASALQQ